MKVLQLCAQRQISVSACVDLIIISFLLTLLHYWSSCAFQQGGLWFKLVNVISAFMKITAEHYLFSTKYSNFFYYICFWHPQHGSTTGFVSLLTTDCFLPYRHLWAFFTQCGWSCCGDKNKSERDTWHEVSCPCLIKCALPGAIQPKPHQLFLQYLVQILGGWENQNRANIAWEKEQLEPADNVEHYFRAAKLGLGTET